MSVNIQSYVEDLFKGYEKTPALRDFQEEIVTNLAERIQDLQKNGVNAEDAFTKAIAELGDITAIADQISQHKRNEIIGKMYVHTQTKVGMKHAIGYVLAGGVALFGLLAALTAYFSTGQIWVSTLIPFLVPAGAGFVYLGLTQETAHHMPMSWPRALIYALASGVVLFGLIVATNTYFLDGLMSHAVVGALIPFLIPGVCVLAFLLLTEKPRHKPWVVEEPKIWTGHYAKKYSDPYSDPQRVMQRGLLSGALWILTISLLIVLWFTFGFKYAWIVFPIAIVLEMLIEYRMHSRN